MSRDLRRAIEEVFERVAHEVSEEVSKAFESLISPIKLSAYITPSGYRRPVSELYLEDDEVVAVIELPGASKDSIDLRIREDELEVGAKFSDDLVKEASRYTIFKQRGYRCSLSLPKPVEVEKAKARYRDGVLVVRMPIQRPRGVAVKVE